MLKHFLNPPNWFTSAGIFCGMYAMVLATGVGVEQNFYKAAQMILFAGVFDMLDGRVARITKRGSAFGVQLDSLADVVSFGLAPALLVYAWGVSSLGVWGLAGAFAFVLCGAFRLARFNLNNADGKPKAFGEGLTITSAGATVASWVMTHAASGRTSVEHPINVLLITLVLSFLMVSSVPYRTFKAKGSARTKVIGFALFMSVMLAISVRFNLSTAFLSFGTCYVLSGPIELLLFRKRHGAWRERQEEEEARRG